MPAPRAAADGNIAPMTLHRRPLLFVVAALAAAGSPGCAGLPGQEPVRVTLVDVAKLPGEAMELRLALRLRVQNPNDKALEFHGVSVALEVRGADFAAGVSDESGTVPAFGERVLTVPVSIGALAVVRQVIGWVTDDAPEIDYEMRGRLGGGALGGQTFRSQGRLQLPRSVGAGAEAGTPAAP
jgi:LEA14-like dessication related protein